MCVCVLIPYLFLAIFLILHIHGGPLTLYMKLPVSSCCSFSFASLISSFSSFLCLTVRSCVITTLLNGLSASLILFKFRNISHFFVSSSIAISNGLSLFLLLFLILLPFLHLYWLYQSYKCFCIVLPSSGYLLPFWSLVQVCLTLRVQNYYILSSVLSFSFFNIPVLQ